MEVKAKNVVKNQMMPREANPIAVLIPPVAFVAIPIPANELKNTKMT